MAQERAQGSRKSPSSIEIAGRARVAEARCASPIVTASDKNMDVPSCLHCQLARSTKVEAERLQASWTFHVCFLGEERRISWRSRTAVARCGRVLLDAATLLGGECESAAMLHLGRRSLKECHEDGSARSRHNGGAVSVAAGAPRWRESELKAKLIAVEALLAFLTGVERERCASKECCRACASRFAAEVAQLEAKIRGEAGSSPSGAIPREAQCAAGIESSLPGGVAGELSCVEAAGKLGHRSRAAAAGTRGQLAWTSSHFEEVRCSSHRRKIMLWIFQKGILKDQLCTPKWRLAGALNTRSNTHRGQPCGGETIANFFHPCFSS